MFKVDDFNNITINEGDFGVTLPITVTGIADGENIRFIIKKCDEDETEVLNKDFSVESGKIKFVLSEEDTKKLPQDKYLYDALQYKKGVIKNSIYVDKQFNVEEGA